MKPKVSIVIPIYNSEKYLPETLDSLRSQTYRNFEIICVDDGSTDKTSYILEKYKKLDKRIRVVFQKNQYAGVARNNGLKMAVGKYIMFLDADDVFERKMLSELVSCAEKNNTDIVYFGFYHFTKDVKHRSMMGIPYSSPKVTSPEAHKSDIFRIAQGIPWNKLYNRQFILNTGISFQPLQSNNDVFFTKTTVLEAKRIVFMKKRFVNYRVDNNGSLQGSYKLNSGNFALCEEAIYENMKSSGKYEMFRDSFEHYVIETYMLIFRKCRDMEMFGNVCTRMKESFDKMEIDEKTKAVSEHPASKMWSEILNGRNEKALFELNKYMEDNFLANSSIEYRIGRKLLSLFRIKSYN